MISITSTSESTRPRLDPEVVLDGVTVVLLPALTIYLGFNAGGYFADTTGWAAVAVAVALAARVAVSLGRFADLSRPLLVAAAGLALFALWTLLSGGWADDYGRALLEFDRVLLYLLVLLLYGSLAQPRAAMRFLPHGLALAAVVLCAAGFFTRALPDSWPWSLPTERDRLAYPVSYSNGLGILASLGIVACLHLASWERERLYVRMLAAAATPLLAATLVLTFSRGAILAGAFAIVVYAILGRPRGMLAAIVATAPFVVLAAHGAYDADLLATDDPTAPAAVDQGADLALTVGLSMLGSAIVMLLCMPLERRLPRSSPGWLSRHWRWLAGAIALPVVIAAVILVPDAIDSVQEDLEGTEAESEQPALTRDRLLGVDGGGQNRVEYWQVSLDAFAEQPLRGTGVGSFEDNWARDREISQNVTEGHSVFLETLGELGLIGAALLLLVFGAAVVAFVIGMRRGPRPLFAAALALSLAWLVHAAIDWDWELPVLTVWLFAFAGAGLASRHEPWGDELRGPAPGWRVLAAAGLLLVAITPAIVALSQSRLDASTGALLRNDCAGAERDAARASDLLPARAEPYEILSYCAARRGQHVRSISLMRQAIDRDPHNWRLVYGLAVVRAASGRDPASAVAEMRRLNPRESLTEFALERLASGGPKNWRREAEVAPIPLG